MNDDLDPNRVPYRNSLVPPSDPAWRVELDEYGGPFPRWTLRVVVPSENTGLSTCEQSPVEARWRMRIDLQSRRHFLHGVPEGVLLAIDALVQDAYDKGAPASAYEQLNRAFHDTERGAEDPAEEPPREIGAFGFPESLHIPYRIYSAQDPTTTTTTTTPPVVTDFRTIFSAAPDPSNYRPFIGLGARDHAFYQPWPAPPLPLKGPSFHTARGQPVKMEWYLPNPDTITGHPRIVTETEVWQVPNWWVTVGRWGYVSEAACGTPEMRRQGLGAFFYGLRYTTSCDGHRAIHRTRGERSRHNVIFGSMADLESIATYIGQDYVENRGGFEEADEVEFRVYAEKSPLVFMAVTVRIVRRVGYESLLSEGEMP